MALPHSPPAGGSLFDPLFLQQLERLRLVSKRLVPGSYLGEHRSHRRGSGVEFADYRPYVEGDPLRSVDWGAYLRFDKLLVRRFEEEGDLPVYFLLDTSSSMAGSGVDSSKLEYARRLAAALSFIALLNLDRVSVWCFAERVGKRLEAARGPNQVFRLFHFLDGLQAGGSTGLEPAVRHLLSLPHRRGLVVVLSDFLVENWESALKLLAGQQHDVLAVRLSEQSERQAPAIGRLRLIDAESQENLDLDIDQRLAERYQKAFEDWGQAVRGRCRKHGWSYLEADVSAPLEALVLAALSEGRLLR